ncbi:diguanylate cyclase (GGDEF)-like protein/PAS domain S-box-containing protein [Desulfobaculum xiamenense]|uniref:Diguanylate cyclase (GGDEF)-like protein/PAS domain S-box-containing protein n=1 Tax=Desulfobaculum xiamenense TaxID=995050 RepID=A0A846QI99_9BACT|nr:EAL domain-containing protein [Desulfobaculum xiamenense]NJB67958.1 diguanylate cyclase (GGDEF)-like protein/PAS domain S-box-containing protein [Desulfobaculum xiamenense]
MPPSIAAELTELQRLRQQNESLRRELAALRNLIRNETVTPNMPEWLPSVVERCPALVVATDADGLIEYANAAFFGALGLPREDVTGQSIFEYAADNTLTQVERRRMMRTLHSGRPWRGLLRCNAADGTCHWLDAEVMRHDDGEDGMRLVGVMEDVTERLRTRSESARQERNIAILYRIANAVNMSGDLGELFPAIHAILLEYIDTPNFYIALVDAERDRLSFPYFADERDTYYEIGNISDPETKSLTLDVIRSGRPLIVRRNDVDEQGVGLRDGISGVIGTMCAQWLGVPLMVEGRITGAMVVQDYEDPEHFSERDLTILSAISGQVALSIERKRMEDALRRSEARYRMVSDSAHDLETWASPQGRLLYVSPSCERITGFTPDIFIDDPAFVESLIHRDDLPLWRSYMECRHETGSDSLDFRIFRKDGRMRWLSVVCRAVADDDGTPMGVRCSMRDITDRKALELRLGYEALHDLLTGLPNRELCLDRMRQVLERAKRREDYYFAVVFLDINRFKVINDSLGHAFGDAVLREAAMRLLHCVRSLDTVSRFGGDEFILLLDELESPREAISAVRRVREALARPLAVGDKEVRLSVSCGVVLSPTDYSEPEELLQNANIALHRAKESRHNRIKVFTERMREQAVAMLHLENDLRRGIDNREFFVLYQPIISLRSGHVIGFEALCRWRHPVRGIVGPGEFIPSAELTGDIIDLGLWVLREACATMAAWQKAYPHRNDLVMSVNISSKQFAQPSLVDQITCIIEETGIVPSSLKLEITESAVMENAESALVMLRRLKALGIQLSIDDFGTGYSSLAYLQRFPVDTLKVDRSFIADMCSGTQNTEIVRAVLVLARTLGLDVIAEGVEESDQINALRGLDCEYVQGFFFSCPLERDAASALLASANVG